jgi:hypothetical protein
MDSENVAVAHDVVLEFACHFCSDFAKDNDKTHWVDAKEGISPTPEASKAMQLAGLILLHREQRTTQSPVPQLAAGSSPESVHKQG